MLQRMPVKDALRVYLARRYAEEELRSWYDPLRIELDQAESCLTVTFPHHLFGSWYATTGQDALESCLALCLGKDIPVYYTSPLRHIRSIAPLSPFSATSPHRKTPFGERFTLDNFICNKKNFFPLAIAREIAKPQKEPSYNPLVYYGKSGSGKTHLLLAIANELSNAYECNAIFYGNILKLIEEFEQRDSSASIDKYQVYCADDIHLFANNFPLQEKLIAFMDACMHGKKQFVCACSGTLASHRGLSESLRSRLELGLTVELKIPDIDVRMRFAQTQCSLHGIDIAQEHMMLLARRCEHLRSLSGVLLKIAAYGKLMQREITQQDIENILKHSGEHSPQAPQDIIRLVAEYFSLPPAELTGNTRKPAPVFARQIAMYLCRDILGTSYPALGKIFGGKDHSTVIYSIKKIEKNIDTHKNTRAKIEQLKHLCAQKHT